MAIGGLYFFVILVIIISSVTKNIAKSKGENHPMNQKRPSAPAKRRPAGGKNVASRAKTANEEYDAATLAYCESTLSPGRGMSFHGLKPGTDELALLVKRNNMRERELERAIQAGNDHTH